MTGGEEEIGNRVGEGRERGRGYYLKLFWLKIERIYLPSYL
jgi:hypothetical protein